MERDRKVYQQFDDAWAARPLRVDNGPMALAVLVPLVAGMFIGAGLLWLGLCLAAVTR